MTTLRFDRPGSVIIDNERWRIVERVHTNGKVFVNVIRRKRVRTVRVK